MGVIRLAVVECRGDDRALVTATAVRGRGVRAVSACRLGFPIDC